MVAGSCSEAYGTSVGCYLGIRIWQGDSVIVLAHKIVLKVLMPKERNLVRLA